jgi:hypothetical protein
MGRPRNTHRLSRIAALSFSSALICGILFFAVLSRSLPPSDGAYGQPLLSIFWDPFVMGGIFLNAGISGLIAIPLAYYLLRNRRILTCGIFAFLVVGLEVVLVTPWLGPVGWFGAYLALVAALMFCRFSTLPIFSLQSDVQAER